MYPPFRVSWQKVIRPSTSFPPPPLKFRTVGFPQYGFKQAVRDALRHHGLTLTFPQWLSRPCAFLFRSRTCVRRHSRLLTPHTCPVALGSASGCIVRRPHRLLWPHPSFCPPPLVSLYANGIDEEQKFPTLLCQGLIPCRRPYSGGSHAPMMSWRAGLGLHPFCRGSATTLTHTPDYVWSH